ncbi:alcohol dehydrogenase [Vanrija albida]|uniref:alcohol dehydrogenase n=1 Tax=Vanrija albida TaxID=181172 RepID=A0ABR3QE66_9TREE
MSNEQIPKVQLAAVSDDASGFTIKEIPVVQPDQLEPGRALVKILYSGVCHTDLHVIKEDWPAKPERPCIAGHEGSGIIVAINDPTSKLKVGDRVGVKWIAHSCNQCDYCLAGNEPLCAEAKCSGINAQGSFQQYCPAYTSQLTIIPDNLDMAEAAPILCAGVTVYKALKRSGARAGQWVAVPGAGGGLGSVAIQYAKYMGLSTIAIDTGAEKKALTAKLGASAWVDFKEHPGDAIIAAVKAATPDGLGPHAAIIASPKPEAYLTAMEYIRPFGTVVAVGLPPAGAYVKADVFFTVLHNKTLTSSYVGNRLDCNEALAIAAAGHVKTPIKVVPFKALDSVYEEMAKGTIIGRAVLDLFA